MSTEYGGLKERPGSPHYTPENPRAVHSWCFNALARSRSSSRAAEFVPGRVKRGDGNSGLPERGRENADKDDAGSVEWTGLYLSQSMMAWEHHPFANQSNGYVVGALPCMCPTHKVLFHRGRRCSRTRSTGASAEGSHLHPRLVSRDTSCLPACKLIAH